MVNLTRVLQPIRLYWPITFNGPDWWHHRLTSIIRDLQGLVIHKKITLARLACLCFVQSCRCSFKVDVVRTKLSLFVQSWRCSYKVVVVRAKLTLFVQSCRCSYKLDVVRTMLTLFVQSWRCSYKVVVVLCTKLTLFCKVWSLFCTKLTLFCTKKEESWQVNFDIKTAS